MLPSEAAVEAVEAADLPAVFPAFQETKILRRRRGQHSNVAHKQTNEPNPISRVLS